VLETPLFAQRSARSDAATLVALRADEAGYLAGDENRTAAAAMELFLDDRAQEAPRDATASPLVLHAPSGLGKTEAARHVATAWARLHPDDVVTYVTGAEFAEQYATAVEHDRIQAFRRKFQGSQLLIVDGVQQLNAKQPAQWELLHTLDALESRAAVLVTIDVCPSRSEALLPAVVGRLMGGTVVGLAPPSLITRRTILSRLAKRTGPPADEGVLDVLSADKSLSLSELSGLFLSLRQTAVIEGRTLDAAMVRDALVRKSDAAAPSMKRVAEEVARRFELTVAELKSHSRRRTIVEARDLAILLSRRLTGGTLQEIGTYFGGRDHTTVLHSCRKLEARLDRDGEFRAMFEEVRRCLIVD